MESDPDEQVSFKTITREEDEISSNWKPQAAGRESAITCRFLSQIKDAEPVKRKQMLPKESHHCVLDLY